MTVTPLGACGASVAVTLSAVVLATDSETDAVWPGSTTGAAGAVTVTGAAAPPPIPSANTWNGADAVEDSLDGDG